MAELVRPDWSEVYTPWPPQPIVWRTSNSSERHEDLHDAATCPQYTHIVREAAVRLGPHRSGSIDELEEGVRWTKREFGLLQACGIRVAPTEWHIWSDPNYPPKLLARVAIINGLDLRDHIIQTRPAGANTYEDWKQKIKRYMGSRQLGKRLQDVDSPYQFIHGKPRDEALAVDLPEDGDTYLVDIEPLFYFENYE